MSDDRDTALRALRAASDDPSADARRQRFDDFMIALEAVGRTWPATTGPAEQAFLDATAPLLARPESALWMWLLDARDRLQPIEMTDDAIENALHDRSALQFLLDLYRDTEAGETLAEVETGRLDEELAALSARGPRPATPDGIPASHGWWRGTPAA